MLDRYQIERVATALEQINRVLQDWQHGRKMRSAALQEIGVSGLLAAIFLFAIFSILSGVATGKKERSKGDSPAIEATVEQPNTAPPP